MKDILKEAIEYKDSMAVPLVDYAADNKTVDMADEVKDAIFDALLAGKLDQTDIAIINARNCSPMPSMRDVAAQLKINIERVHTRVKRIMSLMPKDLQQHFNKKSNVTPSYK